MSKVTTYIKGSYEELTKKVAWTSWSQLMSSALLVMVASVIFAFIIWAIDISFKTLMTELYESLSGK